MLAGTACPGWEIDWRSLDHLQANELAAEVRGGLGRGEFALVYQPRFHLRTGAVLGCEALLRWPGRAGGELPPGIFVPRVEHSAVMAEIGGWALTEACVEARLWFGRSVSVKVSARQLEHGLLTGQVAAALARSGLAPQLLELEFPETILADPDSETLLMLSGLRDLGVELVLKEFGTEWASLAMLRRLPITKLKLARALVHGLPGCHEDAAFLSAITQAAHAMGLSVAAEGIETEAERTALLALGCDEGQGYGLSRPLPPDQVWPMVAYLEDTCSAARSTSETRHESCRQP